MNVRQPAVPILSSVDLSNRRRRFGRIHYETMMGGIDDFAMLFDNVSPYAATRVWTMYFAPIFPFRLSWHWQFLQREFPGEPSAQMTWYEVMRRLFMAWCDCVGVSRHMNFNTIPDPLIYIESDDDTVGDEEGEI
jgi:hypothetical protein